MSTNESPNELHKEFELERVILFSDAVFAIAITLLIIEIKFPELPENYREHLDLVAMFKPTIKHFVGFLISFFLIAVSWARHLRTFRFLKSYDRGLIVRNLISLLFIVTFPFSAEGLTHAKPSFMFPMIIYLGNIMMVLVSHFALTHYIFVQKPELTIAGKEDEKKYFYHFDRVTAAGLFLVFVCALTIGIVAGFNNDYFNYSVLIFVPMMFFIRRVKKKYDPKKKLRNL